ncbi:hypothetical protein Tco_0579988, partial [Tanacetum coccineum]
EEEGEFNGSEEDVVAETEFQDTSSTIKGNIVHMDDQQSSDPFGIHDLLRKKTAIVEPLDQSPSLSY